MKQDLNLLRVFDILMEVRSVSRAADRLRVTQSAVSHALGRLREQLGDPLFVRTRGGLRPTPRASEMAPAIRDGLSLLRDAFSQTRFEPGSTNRVFTVSASSYFSATLLPIVIQRARAEAPLAQFRIVPPSSDLLSGLDEGTIDIALGGFGRYPPRFAKAKLYTESLVWIGRVGSAHDDLDRRPRLALTRTPQVSMPEDVVMRGGLEEHVNIVPGEVFPPGPCSMTIHDPLSAGAFVANSDLITQLPKQLAMMVAQRAQVEILAPSEMRDIEMSMLWHARSTPEPAHIWLRGLMETAAATLG
jgi:DNA-binding transcriptional LysR family regulator